MLVWIAAILFGSTVAAVGLLSFLPSHRDANESVAVNTPVQPTEQKRPLAPSAALSSSKRRSSKTPPAELPDEKPKPSDKSAAKTDKRSPEPPAANPDEQRGMIADPPKELHEDERKGMIADEPTGLPADAPRKPESLGVPEEPKLGVVDDMPKALYAGRTQPKTPEWLAERGGTVESQKAVEDGLNWLARHQGQDGHWGADCLGTDPNSRCDRAAPCKGTGQAYEIAHTGLAMLAFQAAGHYYFNGQKYSDQVKKGLDYFVKEQATDGSIVGSQNRSPARIKAGARFQMYFMYEHAMGTFALCEACAVAIAEGKKPELQYQAAARRAVSFIQNTQHHDGGWRYTVNPREKSDCSVSGWVMLALKTAREAKLTVSPQTISRMMKFFAANYADGQTSYGATPNHTSDAMTGVGMMAVEFFDHQLDSPVVQGGAAYLSQQAEALASPVFGFAPQLPKPLGFDFPMAFDPRNNYYRWYNCTMAMFQVGGEPWQRWNGAVRDRVIALQVQGEGCDRGSWPPNDSYSQPGGRIYSTALAVLTLEVYYRFNRVAGQPEDAKFFEK